MKVVEHLEQYIGKIAKGAEIENRRYNLTISLYENVYILKLLENNKPNENKIHT